jgi:hypothetical protein
LVQSTYGRFTEGFGTVDLVAQSRSGRPDELTAALGFPPRLNATGGDA